MGKSVEDRAMASGGFLVVGWEGREVAEPLELVERIRPAGLIFFRRNFPAGGGPELASQLGAVKQKAESLGISDFILALDNEGGLVRRLPEPFVQLPKASDAGSEAEIAAMAEASGRELRQLGFNVNFAPVLDVDTCGGFMRERCFGSDAPSVARKARAFIEGFAKAGVLCCGKHFPGLGAAVIDPHESLPTVSIPVGELKVKHMAAYQDLAGAGGPLSMVMTTHCLYPGLDADEPATFSPRCVQALREGMFFDGLIFTDDLEMGAVKAGSVGQAAVKALRAGHDLALICRGIANIQAAVNELSSAMESFRIDWDERLKNTRRRIRRAFDSIKREGVTNG